MGAQGQVFFALALVLAVTVMCIIVLRPIAVRARWVDRPTARKRHLGNIPLVGGVSIFVGMSAGILFAAGWMSRFELSLFGTAAAIVFIGVLDDRFDLSARLRVLAQIAVILAMVGFSGVYVRTLGTYFGHELTLGWLGIPFTVMAVAGLLNAFNMADGLDGLCGSLGIVGIGAVVILQAAGSGGHDLALLACMMGVGLVPYLAFNLGLLGQRRRIFLGDAGSVTLGYLLAWTLIHTGQGPVASIRPATVLWFVAVPVIDGLTVMLLRVLHGKSPMSPGREHLHHVLLRAGLSPRQTLLVLVAMALALAAGGALLGEVSPALSLAAFVVLGVGYGAVRATTRRDPNVHDSVPNVVQIPHGVDRPNAANAAMAEAHIHGVNDEGVSNYEVRHASR